MIGFLLFVFKISCWAVGLLKFGLYIYSIVKSVNRNFIRKEQDLPSIFGKESWVLITGCTAGIGEQFAYEFAKRGFNIVLVSRSKSKLEQLKIAINQKYPNTKIKVIDIDLGNSPSPQKISRLDSETKDIDISIVVNNAGVISLNALIKDSFEDINNLINLDVLAPLLIQQLFSQRLIKRSKDHKSAFINVDSCSASSATNFQSIYSGSKGFLRNLSLSTA